MTNGICATVMLTLLFAYSIATTAQPPETFAAAKRLAADIHEAVGRQITVYCGCPYDRKGRSGGDLDRDACAMATRKNDKRSDRLEWEHVCQRPGSASTGGAGPRVIPCA